MSDALSDAPLSPSLEHPDGLPQASMTRDCLPLPLDFLAVALADAAVGFMLLSADYRVLAVNQSFSTMTGHSAFALQGRVSPLFQSLQHNPQVQADMHRSLAEMGRWRGEVQVHRQDETPFMIHLHVQALLDADGLVNRYVLIFSEKTVDNKDLFRETYRETSVDTSRETYLGPDTGSTGAESSVATLPKNRQPVLFVVDDTPTNIELLAGVLSADYRIKFATSGAKALELLEKPDKPDLILLDVMMPGMDGYEVCRRLKENPMTRPIPVIFITAKSEVSDQAHGFNLGAVDYISKPFEVPVLLARVRNHINLKLRTDLLEAQASIDALTGIANRRRFDDVLHIEWKRAERNRSSIALLMLDVDYFKAYNDNYGHGAGDDCLRHLGMALQNLDLRPGDLVCRYGGEEFAVILPGCTGAEAVTIAERIRGFVEGLQLPHAFSHCASVVTVSIGCAMQRPDQAGEISTLFHAADQALYLAKQQGRNRVCLA